MKRPANAQFFGPLRLTWATAVLLAATTVAEAAPVTQPPAQAPASPLLAPIAPPAAPLPGVGRFDTLTGEAALAALAGGHWLAACRMATAVLARQVPDVNAIGLFGVCAAVNDDRASAQAALARLGEVEKPPYFGLLVEAVLLLHERPRTRRWPPSARRCRPAPTTRWRGTSKARHFMPRSNRRPRSRPSAPCSRPGRSSPRR